MQGNSHVTVSHNIQSGWENTNKQINRGDPCGSAGRVGSPCKKGNWNELFWSYYDE